MKTSTIFAYATNVQYDTEARKLILSCVANQQQFHYSSPENFPFDLTWKQSVLLKPKMILEALCSGLFESLLYVDADAVLKGPLDIDAEFKDADVSWHAFKRLPSWSDEDREFLTGTMFFRNTQPVREFLARWDTVTQTFHWDECPEQKALKVVWPEFQNKLVWKNMRPEFVWIFDTMPELFPDRKPVIEHYQKSRVYRDTIA